MPVTAPDSAVLTRHYVVVAKRWRTADGQWCVDAIRLSATPDSRDGDWLRVRWRCYWKADVRTVAELARLVPLDQLAEAPLAPGRPRWQPGPPTARPVAGADYRFRQRAAARERRCRAFLSRRERALAALTSAPAFTCAWFSGQRQPDTLRPA
jgi:hypothetical protein